MFGQVLAHVLTHTAAAFIQTAAAHITGVATVIMAIMDIMAAMVAAFITTDGVGVIRTLDCI